MGWNMDQPLGWQSQLRVPCPLAKKTHVATTFCVPSYQNTYHFYLNWLRSWLHHITSINILHFFHLNWPCHNPFLLQTVATILQARLPVDPEGKVVMSVQAWRNNHWGHCKWIQQVSQTGIGNDGFWATQKYLGHHVFWSVFLFHREKQRKSRTERKRSLEVMRHEVSGHGCGTPLRIHNHVFFFKWDHQP